jgi:transcriptional regulator with XRE-family HTH domain
VREFAPHFRRESLLDSRGHCDLFGKVGSSLNGLRGVAVEAAAILEELTCCSALRWLNLSSLESILSARSSVRIWAAWCPKCLQDQRDLNSIIYEPLLWYLKPVSLCPNHPDVLLVENCPHCHRRHFPLERYSTPGFCPKCQGWLGSTRYSSAQPDEGSQRIIAVATYGLIEALGNGTCKPSLPILRSNLKAVVRNAFGGSLNEFARASGMHHSSLSSLLHGSAKPGLDTLLQLAATSRFPVWQLLTSRVPARSGQKAEAPFNFPRRTCRKYDWKKITRLIENELASGETHISLHSVCKRHGFDSGYVTARLPVLARMLIDTFRSQTECCHRNREEGEFRDLELAVSYSALRGQFPSFRRLKKMLEVPGSLRDPRLAKFRNLLLSNAFQRVLEVARFPENDGFSV